VRNDDEAAAAKADNSVRKGGETRMALYQIGDLLVYGRTGVCRVDALNENAAQLYYQLHPLYQNCSISIPVGNTKVFMRPIVSAPEAEELISELPEMEAEPYYNRNLNQLREYYREKLDGYSCLSLALFVLSLYRKRREVQAAGKKFGAVDERFLKEAEDLLCGELAAALDTERDEVRRRLTPAQ